MTLPAFRYHPDPIGTGSVVPSDARCPCCGRARGFAYTGPIYTEEELADDSLCPWCIADGSAHRKYGATFVDAEAFDEEIPDAAMAEIAERTPGYSAWQSEAWPACCGDATAFLGPAGIAELRAIDPSLEGLLMSHVVHEMGISGGAATRLVDSLHRDRGPTAYLFRCLECRRYHFHVDSH